MTDTRAAAPGASAKEQQAADEKPRQKLRPLRELLPFLLKYPTRLTLTIGFLLIAAVTQLSIPLFFGGLIDQGFVEQNLDQVAQYGGYILILAGVMAVASGFRFYFISIIGERVLTDLRSAVFNHLLQLDSTFYDTHRVGELTSRLNGDVATVRQAIGSSASMALRSMVTITGALIMMFLTSTTLSLFVVIGLPLIVFPIVYFARRLRGMSRNTQDRLADLSAMATEVLSATKTIKAFVQEDTQSDLYAVRAEESFDAEKRRLKARSLLMGVITFVAVGAVILLIWGGARAVFEGAVSLGQLGQFMIYALMASSALMGMSEVFGSLQTVAGATERLVELLKTESNMPVAEHPVKLPEPPLGTVSFENVRFAYSTRRGDAILQGLSFEVGAGETVALVGASGAGKSTVFGLLQRFYDVEEGAVKVDGVDVRQVLPQDLRHRFAYVEQDSIVFAGTVAENIRFGRPDATDEEVFEAAKAALVDEYVNDLPSGYDTIVGERGVMLSGGQKQRLAIARALLKDAPILLLDEATSALDAQSENLVQQALERLMQGRTTLVIAHRLATIRDADRILVLDSGELIDEGTHEQLIKRSGRYSELAKLQFDQQVGVFEVAE